MGFLGSTLTYSRVCYTQHLQLSAVPSFTESGEHWHHKCLWIISLKIARLVTGANQGIPFLLMGETTTHWLVFTLQHCLRWWWVTAFNLRPHLRSTRDPPPRPAEHNWSVQGWLLPRSQSIRVTALLQNQSPSVGNLCSQPCTSFSAFLLSFVYLIWVSYCHIL